MEARSARERIVSRSIALFGTLAGGIHSLALRASQFNPIRPRIRAKREPQASPRRAFLRKPDIFPKS